MRNVRILAALAAALSGTVLAGETDAVPDAPGGAVPASRDWTFAVSPYVWAAGMSGQVGQFGQPVTRVKSSFEDIVSDLDVAFMGAFEGRRGRYSVVGDLFYASTSVSSVVTLSAAPLIQEKMGIRSRTFSGMLGGGYSLVLNDKGNLDFVAGARVWHASTRFTSDGLVLGVTSASDSATWVDGVAGFRGTRFITDRIYLTGWGMAGAGQSRSDWDLMAAIGYKISDSFSLAAGYRAMGVDYRHGEFVYDVTQRGPILGLTYGF